MLRPSKILIVDDEPFNVDYLEQELEDLGYTTVSARNGREALEKVALETPDLILTAGRSDARSRSMSQSPLHRRGSSGARFPTSSPSGTSPADIELPHRCQNA